MLPRRHQRAGDAAGRGGIRKAPMSVSPSARHRSVIVARLRAAGCVFAEDEARLLMSAARTPADLAAMVDRRAAGEPLEHVLGWAEFCGLRIAVDPGVFVPRRRPVSGGAGGVPPPRGPAARGGPGRAVLAAWCGGPAGGGAAPAGAGAGGGSPAAAPPPAGGGGARRNVTAVGGRVY